MAKIANMKPLFDQTKSTMPGYTSNYNDQLMEQRLIANDQFLRTFQEPNYVDQQKNLIMSSVFEDVLGETPFITGEDGSLEYDNNAKWQQFKEDDTPKTRAFKEVWDTLKKGRGTISSPGFIERSFNRSMTVQLADWMEGRKPYGDFLYTKGGFSYKGQHLDLNDKEMKVIGDLIERKAGSDVDRSFLESTAEVVLGLTLDIPLLIGTGALASKAVGVNTTLRNLAESTSFFPRLLGQGLQQTINFNLLGLPAVSNGYVENGVDGAAKAIWDNTTMGFLAAATGTAGMKLASASKHIPGIAKILSSRPALRQELGGLSGSFGFGYVSGKMMGESDINALSHGLAFAATHFTNPRAYGKIISEQASKDLQIFTEDVGDTKAWKAQPDYFLKKDKKLFKINRNDFKDKGVINVLDGEGIDINSDVAKSIIPYNMIMDSYTREFYKTLAEDRQNQRSEKLYQRWVKGKSPEWVEKNGADLAALARLTSVQINTAELSKLFGKWKLPDDVKLTNEMIKLAEDIHAPYHAVKKIATEKLSEYVENPEQTLLQIRNSGMIGPVQKQFEKVLETAKESLINHGMKKDPFAISFADWKNQIEYHKLKLGEADPDDIGTIVYHSDKLKQLTDESIKRKDAKKTDGKKEYQKPTVDTEANTELLAEIERLKKEQTEEQKRQANKRAFKALQEPEKTTAEALYNKKGTISGKDNVQKEVGKKSTEIGGKLAKNEIEKTGQENSNKPSNTITPEEKVRPGQSKEEIIPEKLGNISSQEILKTEAEKAGMKPINLAVHALKDRGMGRRRIAQTLEESKQYPDLTFKQLDDKVSNIISKKSELDKYNKWKESQPKQEKAPEPIVEEQLVDERTLPKEKETLYDESNQPDIYDEATATEETVLRNPIPNPLDKRVKNSLEKDVNKLDKALTDLGINLLKPGGYEKAQHVMKSMKLKKGETALDYLIDKASGLDRPLDEYTNELYSKKKGYRKLSETEVKKAVADINARIDKLGLDLKATHNINLNAAGRVSLADKLLEIGKNPTIDTPEHEWGHIGALLLGKEKVWKRILKGYGWDGKGDIVNDIKNNPTLRQAHEGWAEEYADVVQGYSYDRTGFIPALKMIFKRIARWLRGEGYYDKADYMNMLADGKLKPRNKDIPSDNTLYSKWAKDIIRNKYLDDELVKAYEQVSTLKPPLSIKDSLQPFVNSNQFGELLTATDKHSFNLYKNMLLRNVKFDIEQITNWKSRKIGKFDEKSLEKIAEYDDTINRLSLWKEALENLTFIEKEGYEKPDAAIDKDGNVLWSKRVGYETDNVKNLFEDQIAMEATTDITKDANKEMKAFLDKASNESFTRNALNLYRMTATPPAFMKYISPRFNKIREPLEKGLVRSVPYTINQILKDPKGWNDGKLLRELPEAEQQGLVDIVKDLRKAIYDGEYDPNHTPFRFEKDFNLTEGQIKVWDAYQKAIKQARDIAREGLKDRLIKFNGSVATNAMRPEDIEKFFEKDAPNELNVYNEDGTINFAKADKIINEDPLFKEDVAEYLANKVYNKYENVNYVNDVRPATPDTYIISGYRKSTNRNHEEQADGSYIERFSTYAQPVLSEKLGMPPSIGIGMKKTSAENEAKRLIKEYEDQGYTIEKTYRIGDILGEADFWDKLTAQQLSNLVNAGHVPMTDEVVKKLFASIKTGSFEEHGIKKSWIPGMHNTLEEFETGLHRFVAQGVNSKFRQNAILESRELLREWQKRIDTEVKEGKGLIKDLELQKQEIKYATKYFNGITHSDNSRIDAYRNVVSTFYTALKGSFLLQQSLQGLQTTWHLARGEGSVAGISGDKSFYQGTQDAFKYAYATLARKKGERITDENIKPDQEFVKMIQDLDDMNLMGKTYIEEMFGASGSIENHYAWGAQKYGSRMKKAMNILSAGIEKFTRIQSAGAFYRIGKAKGLEGDALTQWVGDKINETMSQWGVAGRPPVAASKHAGTSQAKIVKDLEKSFYTFKTFATHNLGLYEYLTRNKMYGALASKAFVGMGIHGITKFPFLATMFAIANLFTDNDTEHELMSLLDEFDESTGTKIGKMFGRGAPAAMGIDMSRLMDERSAFATDLISETRSRSAVGKLAEAGIGAPAGYTNDLLDAAQGAYDFAKQQLGLDQTVSEAERKRAFNNLIKFTPLAFRNIVKALDFKIDGVELRGQTIIKRDDLSWSDVIYKALGFNPTDVNDTIENEIHGFPNKFKRLNSKISKIKSIRKEIATSKKYTRSERSRELMRIAHLLRQAQRDKAIMMASPEYKQMIINKQRRRR